MKTFTRNISELKKLQRAQQGSAGEQTPIPSNVEPVFDQDSQDDQRGQDDQQGEDSQDSQQKQDNQDSQEGQQGQEKQDDQGGQEKQQVKGIQGDQHDKDKGSKGKDITLPNGQKPFKDIPLDPNALDGVKGLEGSDTKNTQPKDIDDLRDMVKKAEEITESEKRIENKTKDRSGKPGGKGQGGFRSLTSDDFPTKRNWRQILRSIISKTSRTPTNLYSNPRMRALGSKVHFPGSALSMKGAQIILALDTSGSITDDILAGFMSDVRKIFDDFRNDKEFGVKAILWHSSPYAESKVFTGREFVKCKDWIQSHWKGGGTDIGSVVNYINMQKLYKEFKGIVWLTDGETNIPNDPLPDMYNIFVIVGDYLSEYTKSFLKWVLSQSPKGKKPNVIRTLYK